MELKMDTKMTSRTSQLSRIWRWQGQRLDREAMDLVSDTCVI